MKEDDPRSSSPSAPRGSRGARGRETPHGPAGGPPRSLRHYAPLLIAALIALAFAGWWLRRPAVTSTTLPTLESSEPTVAPLVLDTGAHLSIVAPEFLAELGADGRGRILGVTEPIATPRASTESGAGTANTSMTAYRPLALDDASCSQLFSDLGRIRADWAARTAGEEAAETGAASGGRERPTLIVEEVRSDRSTRLLFELTPSSPEYSAAGEALTPLRLAR